MVFRCFFAIILNMINNNEQGQEFKTTMNDLEMFVRVIIVCCFYGQSPKAMWDQRNGFQFFKKVIGDLGGIQKFIHIISCIKSPKLNDSSSWYRYFDQCNSIRELESVISKTVHHFKIIIQSEI